MFDGACRLLIEKLDFQQTFIITAAIKAVSFAPLLVLLVLLEEGSCCFACLPSWRRRALEQSILDAADPEANPALTSPLLAEMEEEEAEDRAPKLDGVKLENGETVKGVRHENGEASSA